jgi:hypothetical protein
MNNEAIRTLAELLAIGIGAYSLHLVAILAHEAGHAVAGRIAGFACTRIEVGPFFWSSKDGFGFRLRFVRLLSGKVQAHFRNMPRSAATLRCVVFATGGPLASFAVAALAALLGAYVHVWPAVATILMVDSGLIAVFTLLPGRSGGYTTDGMKVWLLLFSGSKKRHRLIHMYTLQTRIEELRRVWTDRNFPEALKITDDLIEASQSLLNLTDNDRQKMLDALGRFRGAALRGIADPSSVDIQCVQESANSPVQA